MPEAAAENVPLATFAAPASEAPLPPSLAVSSFDSLAALPPPIDAQTSTAYAALERSRKSSIDRPIDSIDPTHTRARRRSAASPLRKGSFRDDLRTRALSAHVRDGLRSLALKRWPFSFSLRAHASDDDVRVAFRFLELCFC